MMEILNIIAQGYIINVFLFINAVIINITLVVMNFENRVQLLIVIRKLKKLISILPFQIRHYNKIALAIPFAYIIPSITFYSDLIKTRGNFVKMLENKLEYLMNKYDLEYVEDSSAKSE